MDPDLPDLDAVDETIDQAKEAKEELVRVAPNAINPAEEQDQAPEDVPTEADTGVTEVPAGPRAESDEPG